MATAMAPPSSRARMRLTIEVLPLTPDNAHGPQRSCALASLKGRKFALPVSTDDTFETVWGQIEHRYTTSYLNAQQAANFTIKKLQDAYDCDLFMTDTVGSIYEGETDPALRLIKVVPTFLDRDFSVPATSSLRPAHAQKRARERDHQAATKRRRTAQSIEAIDLDALGPPRDQPVPSTECNGRSQRSRSRTSRSATGSSLVLVHGTQTGQAEFAPAIKVEAPEPGSPPVQPAADSRRASEAVEPVVADVAVSTHDPNGHAHDEGVQTPQRTTQESAIRHSLPPTSAQRNQTPPRVATKRPNVYDVPSSPEFLSNETKKAKTTYGRKVTTPQSALRLLPSPVKPASSSPIRPGSLKEPAELPPSYVTTSQKAGLGPVPALPTSPKNNQVASAQPRKPGRPRKNPGHLTQTCIPTPRPEIGRPRKSPVAEALPNLAATDNADNAMLLKATSPAESFIQQSNVNKTGHENTVPSTNARSRSGSAAISTHSSPVLLRQPARYLSHSPSAAGSASDRASEEPSVLPPKLVNGAAVGSDSSSADDESSTEEESDTDVQQTGLPDATAYQITSSPPAFQNVPISTPSFPATSQPIFSQEVRHTPIPLPSNVARTEASRSAARYTGFPTLREQLVDAKTPSNSSQMKPYDPRLASLAKLAVKHDVNPASVDESSDEESSSSDSD